MNWDKIDKQVDELVDSMKEVVENYERLPDLNNKEEVEKWEEDYYKRKELEKSKT